jgi:hypothetical protein
VLVLHEDHRDAAVGALVRYARVPARSRGWALTDLHDEDLYLLAVVIARSNIAAELERQLALVDRDTTPHRFERRSAVVAFTLMTLTLIAVLVLCSSAWRFLA